MPLVLARTERLILLNQTERKVGSLELSGSVPPPTCHCGEQNKSYPAKGHQSPSQKPAPDCRRSKPDQPHGVASYYSRSLYTVDFLEFYKTQGTIGFPVRIALLINIPKGFSSKMTLEVAKIGLKVSTQYML